MSWKTISAWAGGVTATIAVIVAMLWGVPHYLKTQVHALYEAEQVEAALDGPPEAVTAVVATVGAMQLQLTGMETRMIDRDKLFMAYLERQAELAAARNR